MNDNERLHSETNDVIRRLSEELASRRQSPAYVKLVFERNLIAESMALKKRVQSLENTLHKARAALDWFGGESQTARKIIAEIDVELLKSV